MHVVDPKVVEKAGRSSSRTFPRIGLRKDEFRVAQPRLTTTCCVFGHGDRPGFTGTLLSKKFIVIAHRRDAAT